MLFRGTSLALFYLTAATTISSLNFFVQGNCTHFFDYVPLESGPSPPCDPTGVWLLLHCSGFAPPSSSVRIIWMFTPDLNTPYIEISFVSHPNWLPIYSSNVVISGPYTGYLYKEGRVGISPGVQPDIMGYYACTFKHTSTATTPVFALTPPILINATPGITTPCPTNNFFSFAELMSPEICAEAVVTTTPEPVITTQDNYTTTESQSTVSDGKKCCGHAAYIGIAAALFTSICICIVGASAFAISVVFHRIQKKRHRKLFVDRNVIDPRNSEEHHLGIDGCKACAKLREND